MRKYKCKFCDHTINLPSSYRAHALLREHLKQEHPTDFAVLRYGEHRIEQMRGQLGDRFGWAARPRNMNPE